jgi:septal ring factor EnvC (AmiA/AmiB activator)
MAITTGRNLLARSNVTRQELTNSIAALNKEKNYIQKCIYAQLRDRESGNSDIDEISELIQQLEAKLECTN